MPNGIKAEILMKTSFFDDKLWEMSLDSKVLGTNATDRNPFPSWCHLDSADCLNCTKNCTEKIKEVRQALKGAINQLAAAKKHSKNRDYINYCQQTVKFLRYLMVTQDEDNA